MDGTPPELLLDAVGTAGHLLVSALIGELGNGEMTFGVSADRNQRVGGHSPDLVPLHYEPRTVCGHVHIVAVGERTHHAALSRLVERTQPPIGLLEGAGFLLRGPSPKPPQRTVAAKLDLGSAGDDLFKCEPPQFAVAIGIVRRHVERERQRAALEQGIGVFEIVAITVVEGEAGSRISSTRIPAPCAKGLALYDIGVGAGRHKDEWADVVEPLFDSFIAFKLHGLALTLPLAALSRLKRAIKSNQYLWPLAQTLRTRLLGTAEPSA